MKQQRLTLILFLTLSLLGSCVSKKEKEAGGPAIKPDSTPVSVRENRANPYAPVDISPMDMSYFPVDYPKLKMTHSIEGPPQARIIYSRPHLQGRHIFHEVLKYGEPWRLGANESTELDLYQEAVIGDKRIPAGRYVIYCIPQPDQWTIVLNTNIDSWGLEPDPSRDTARFTIPVSKVNSPLEYFTIVFEKTGPGADLLMAWDNIEARLPVRF